MASRTTQYGKVVLVGAGPGDPELLTMKAYKCIQDSDLIVYDNLVSQEIRALFPTHTRTVFVGKSKGAHHLSQEQINHLLAKYARQGMNICRLKGGDGFIFGRGGEEMLTLAQQGVSVDVIPGITAASGCTSYAQIPLTHRGTAQGCTFITAHAEKNLSINWKAIAELNQTLVIYMGLTKTQEISDALITANMSPNTPVALIENGCTPQQRQFKGELQHLTELRDSNGVSSPALIVIGDVVKVSQRMEWLERLNVSQSEERVIEMSQTA